MRTREGDPHVYGIDAQRLILWTRVLMQLMCEHNDFDTLRILSITLLELSYVMNLFVEKMFGIILNVASALQICFKTFVR